MRRPMVEYSEYLKKIFHQMNEMASCFPTPLREESNEVSLFARAYACYGYPGDAVGDFELGSWIFRSGNPAKQHNAISIIPCFSDDVLPVTLPQDGKVDFGKSIASAQIIILFSVDQMSVVDAAWTLFHELRHARHRLGAKLAGLLPLDISEEVHEGNTWMFCMDILAAWGGELWERAISREVDWLRKQRFAPLPANEFMYHQSGVYWPELDELFGPCSNANTRLMRQKLLSLPACATYWTTGDAPVLSYEQVFYSLVVNYFYK